MRCLDYSFDNPEENILFDEVLLQCAQDGHSPETLRFWESQRTFVVLGRISSLEEDVNFERTNDDNIPVLRRSSGGGTVVQGKGCLNYSLILSKKQNPDISHLKSSYEFVIGKVINALSELDIEAQFYPISDIALTHNQKKISGNAQKRLREFILHHGTILYDFDLELIERYLKIPKSIPEYRNERPHQEFVTNIDCSASDIKKSLSSAFQANDKLDNISATEKSMLADYLQSKSPLIETASNTNTK